MKINPPKHRIRTAGLPRFFRNCATAALVTLAAPFPILAGPPPGTGNWTLVLDENFDTFDTTRWSKGMRWADAINGELHANRPENVSIVNGKCVIAVNMKRASVNHAAGYPVGATVLNIDGFNEAIPDGTKVRIGVRIKDEQKPDGSTEDRMYTVASSVGGSTPTQITLTTPLRHAAPDNTRVVITAPMQGMSGPAWGGFDYRSGAIQSYNKWTQTYGYYEARIKMTAKKGTWPAFWLLPDRGPSFSLDHRIAVGTRDGAIAMGNEIDIFEYMGSWKDPVTGMSSSHSGYFWDYGSGGNINAYTMHKQLPEPDVQFHNYGLYWGPGILRFYIDGRAVWSNFETGNVAACPHYVIFNVAVHTNDWTSGPPLTQEGDIDPDMPSSMEIDYFRVWSGTGGAGETTGDIGTVATPGSHTFNAHSTTIVGNGAGIGGTADAFHFVPQELKGDGSVTVRLASLSNPNAAAKAGIMFRENLDEPGSKNVFLGKNPAGTPHFQYRSILGGSTASSTGGSSSAAWLRLARSGNTFTGSVSSDGVTWTQIGSQNVTMASTIHVGLAVTSNTTGASTATATFDNFKLSPAFQPLDIYTDWGALAFPGSTTRNGNTFTVQASGQAFGGNRDSGHFGSQQMVGDCMITARVASITGGSTWQAAAGVMMREHTEDSARNVFVSRTPLNARFQYRSSIGALTEGGSFPSAQWVRLKRVGNVFTGYTSSDGITWTQIGEQTIDLAETLYVGLAASAKSSTSPTTAVFENVSFNDWGVTPPQTAIYEAENIETAVSSDNLTVATDSYASAGAFEALAADQVGDYVTYTVPVAQPGTYSVKLRFKRYTPRGQYQLTIDGVNQGGVQDQYGTGAFVEVDLGTKVFTSAGNKAFTFTVTGRNASSTSYMLTFDTIKLVPQ